MNLTERSFCRVSPSPSPASGNNEVMALMLSTLLKHCSTHTRVKRARRAAEEVAADDSRLSAIDMKLAVLQALVGVNVALTSGVLWLAFSILGALCRDDTPTQKETGDSTRATAGRRSSDARRRVSDRNSVQHRHADPPRCAPGVRRKKHQP